MAKLNVKVPHLLKKDEAIKRVKTILGEVKTQFADKMSDLHEEWNGDECDFDCKAMGNKVLGKLKVTQRDMKLSGNFPDEVSLFQKEFESALEKRAQTLLAR